MKTKDLMKVILIAVISGIISIIVAGAIFKKPIKNAQVPVVEPISTSFPQVSTDSNYQAIFNNNSLDPTQLIQIGNSQNSVPFSNSP